MKQLTLGAKLNPTGAMTYRRKRVLLTVTDVLVNVLQHHKVPSWAQSFARTESNPSRGLLTAIPYY